MIDEPTALALFVLDLHIEARVRQHRVPAHHPVVVAPGIVLAAIDRREPDAERLAKGGSLLPADERLLLGFDGDALHREHHERVVAPQLFLEGVGVDERIGVLKLDLILDTVSAAHDYGAYLRLLRPRGVMVIVGVPTQPTPLHAGSLIGGNKRLVGSMIGGIAETQAMLDHCAAHGVVSDIEIIPIQEINEAYERVLNSDVRYRFVIDLASLTA